MSEQLDEWFAWRERERRKHRTMTTGEYEAWQRGGDVLSDSHQNDPFLGGLTIVLGPSVIGWVTNAKGPPTLKDTWP